MNVNSLTQILTILLIVMIFILMILSIIFLVLKMKDNTKKETKEKNKNTDKIKNKTKASNTEYNKQSIIDFIDCFDMKPEEIRRSVEHLTWKRQMQKVSDELSK